MALTDTWNSAFETSPAGEDDIGDGDNRIRELKRALRERIEKSSYIRDTNDIYGVVLVEDDEGRSKPGNNPAVFFGTTAEIDALTGLSTNGGADKSGGELAYDTDDNVLKIYNGTDWTTRTISGDVLGGPIIASSLLIANLTQSGFSANLIDDQVDLTEVTNEDDTVLTQVGTCPDTGNAMLYFDLGAVYQGAIKLLVDCKTATGAGHGVITPVAAYDSGVLNTTTLVGASQLQAIRFFVSTYATHSSITNFYGRYVGFYVGTAGGSGTISIKVRRLEVHGTAV